MKGKWGPSKYMALNERHDYLEECFHFIVEQMKDNFHNSLHSMHTKATAKVKEVMNRLSDFQKDMHKRTGKFEKQEDITDFMHECVEHLSSSSKKTAKVVMSLEEEYVSLLEHRRAIQMATESTARGSSVKHPIWGELLGEKPLTTVRVPLLYCSLSSKVFFSDMVNTDSLTCGFCFQM